MSATEADTKERILTATIELLQMSGARQATVRAIAERAGVGIGLINYHFGSKEALLYRAAASIIGDRSVSAQESYAHPEVDAETRLRQLVRERGRIVDRYPHLFEIVVRHELLEAEYDLPQQILPLLREMFGGQKKELELRLIAFSLVMSVRMALLRPEAFRKFTGLDLMESEQRELALDLFAKNILAHRVEAS